LGRSKTDLGSSKGYPKTADFNSGYFSMDQKINPLMYNWNLAYFKYCDGGSFSGNNETVTPVSGTPLYFRGFRILQGYHEDLSTNHNLMSGTDFIIMGCSAGGLATYLHVDWWASQLPKTATVKGMPDSGFFLDYDAPSGRPRYSSDMKWVFEAMNATSGVNQDCIAAHTATKDTNLCFFAEHTSPHIKTPIFPLQSEYDSWQTGNILGSTNAAEINAYGKLLVTRFKTAVFSDEKFGGFLDSCYHHCGAWDSIRINSTLSGDALYSWYNRQNNGEYFQDKAYPCDTCCKP